MKKLSIITICLNEPNVEKTCESIVKQTWQDFEWIVIDGGSNADTLAIFEKYKGRIDKFISEPDEGIYDACNKGIKLASGEFVNFMNAGDCFFYNDVLKDVFENKTYYADVLYGNEYFLGEDIFSDYIQAMPPKLTKDFFYFLNIRHQSSFFCRALFDKYGLYDDNFFVAGDYKKNLIFFENNVSFKYIPYTIAYFNSKGISNAEKSRNLCLNERNKVVREHFSEIEIETLKQKYKSKFKSRYSFLERIFSIKNTPDKRHKAISILGVRFKFKKANKEL